MDDCGDIVEFDGIEGMFVVVDCSGIVEFDGN